MSTFTQILYQIVFGTKNKHKTMLPETRKDLYKYINGILVKKTCHVYQINGVEDHLHIITHLHPTVSLASLVKDIKLASDVYLKETGLFPAFDGWQDGYGAFTYSQNSKEKLIEYVKNQEEHHKTVSFRDEYIKFLKEEGIDFDERFVP